MYTTPPPARHDPYAALRFRDFRLLIIGTFFAIIGEQMIGVAIGWELYERTGQTLYLGLVGLVQVIPVVLLALPAGHIADRFDRKKIMMLMLLALSLCSLGLGLLSWRQGSLIMVYACLLVIGIARSFQGPASSALVPQLIPEEHYANAATWQSTAWQSSSIIGPALGGLIIALQHSATTIYFIDAALLLGLCGVISLLRPRPVQLSTEPATLNSLLAGLKFVYRTKVILASITLDMVAVLLGGATALLPVFAKDILHVGPTGLGLLRTAPALGAVIAALALAHLPPFRRAGRTLLIVVAGFGVATIVFGLSTSFPLSLLMLALLGGLDSVSVVIRSTLLMLRTPDAMRGRVNAVHNVFVGLSNELGAFESGLAAALLGTTVAVAAGGVGTILVVGAVALVWPEVRRLGRLDNAVAEAVVPPLSDGQEPVASSQ
ncbi:MAG TPA: MFS transporter [Herpetosiphonaceae bacterium]|nr:MFS transporter [Herpetosiphonaceae bacterium]